MPEVCTRWVHSLRMDAGLNGTENTATPCDSSSRAIQAWPAKSRPVYKGRPIFIGIEVLRRVRTLSPATMDLHCVIWFLTTGSTTKRTAKTTTTEVTTTTAGIAGGKVKARILR